MRILVTGGAGFIGSNLARKCVEEGHDIDVVDNLSNGHISFVPHLLRTDNLYICNFDSKQILDKIRNKEYEVVVHLAAIPRVSYSVEHPLETNETNVSATLKLIDACKGNVKRFVFASSSSVYGGAENLPTEEKELKNPKSPYAFQKSIIEDYLKIYYDNFGLDSVSLRFFNVLAPIN